MLVLTKSLTFVVIISLIFVLVFTLRSMNIRNEEAERFRVGHEIRIGSEGMGYSWGAEPIAALISSAFSNYKIVFDNNDPDLIVRSHFLCEAEPLIKKKVAYITWSGESTDVKLRDKGQCLLQVVSTNTNKDNGIPFLYIPMVLWRICPLPYVRRFTDNDRPKFLAYINSNCVPERDDLFRHILNLRPDAEALGKCSRNIHEEISGGWSGDAIIKTYSEYRFAFALENTRVNGYVTEKLTNVYTSGAIPITNVDRLTLDILRFNPESYININDFETLEIAAEYIVNLDNDKEKTRKMLSASVFLDNIPGSLFDFQNTPSPSWMKNAGKNLLNSYLSQTNA